MKAEDKYKAIVVMIRAAALVALLITLYIGLFVSKEAFEPEGSTWLSLLSISLWIQAGALLALMVAERKKKKAARQRAENGTVDD